MLTDAQKTDQPVEKPVRNLPEKRMAKNPRLLSVTRIALAIKMYPQSDGTPPMMRAACLPKRSETGQARRPPIMAPTVDNACKKGVKCDLTELKYNIRHTHVHALIECHPPTKKIIEAKFDIQLI